MNDPMNRLLADIIKQTRHERKMLIIALVISIFLNFAEAVTFAWLYSQWDYQTTTTTTTEQTVDGDDGSIVNGNQFNDQSQDRSTK